MTSLSFIDAAGKRRTVRLNGKALASGADGSIYLLDGLSPPSVAKLYHEHRLDPERQPKLAAMMANPPSLADITLNGKRYVQIAWPTGELHDSAGFRGFAMPSVDLKQSTTLEMMLSPKTRKAYGLPEHYGYQVTAALNVAKLIAELHEHRHYVIDLKPVNINIYTDSQLIAMLDTDGFSIAGADGQRFAGHQYTADYIAPEAWKRKQTPDQLGEAQDLFALAVVIFRLLNRGVHPFQGVPQSGRAKQANTNQDRVGEGLYAYGRRSDRRIAPSPWSLHEYLPDDLRRLFDKAFTGAARPSAADWVNILEAYAKPDTGKLKQCTQHADHAYFAGEQCGHCALLQQRAAVEQQQHEAKRAPRRTSKRTSRRRNHSGRRAQHARQPAAQAATVGVSVRPQRITGTTIISATARSTRARSQQSTGVWSGVAATIKSNLGSWWRSGWTRWLIPLALVLLLFTLWLDGNVDTVVETILEQDLPPRSAISGDEVNYASFATPSGVTVAEIRS